MYLILYSTGVASHYCVVFQAVSGRIRITLRIFGAQKTIVVALHVPPRATATCNRLSYSGTRPQGASLPEGLVWRAGHRPGVRLQRSE